MADISGDFDSVMVADMSDLKTRMDAADPLIAAHGVDITSLKAWRAAKATNIAKNTTTPSSAVVDILGVQVPTGASFTGLRAFVMSMRDQNNSILDMLVAREIMA